MNGTILSYTDSETGERVNLDVDGWQFVIDTSNGEVCRMDLVLLALMVKMQAPVAPDEDFTYSLLTPPGSGGALFDPPDWWIDVLISKRGRQ